MSLKIYVLKSQEICSTFMGLSPWFAVYCLNQQYEKLFSFSLQSDMIAQILYRIGIIFFDLY